MVLQIQTDSRGVVFLQQKALTHATLGVFMANGVAEFLPLTPFPMQVMSLSRAPRTLPKNIVLGHVVPHPIRVLVLQDDVFLTGESLAEFPEPVAEGTTTDWKGDMDLTHINPDVRDRAYKMLEKHQKKWEGSLELSVYWNTGLTFSPTPDSSTHHPTGLDSRLGTRKRRRSNGC